MSTPPEDRASTDREPRDTRTDASAGWREEYENLHVRPLDETTSPQEGVCPCRGDSGENHPAHTAFSPPAVADGGLPLPKPGERRRDRRSGDGVVVLATRPKARADEVTLPSVAGGTVAAQNPEYPTDAGVARVAFLQDVAEAGVTPATRALRRAARRGDLDTYWFPLPRLTRAEEDKRGAEGGGEEDPKGREESPDEEPKEALTDGGVVKPAAERVGDPMLEDVRDPSDLLPAEKTTQITFERHADRLRIISDERGITRRLLAHKDAVIRSVRVEEPRPRNISPHEWDGETIVGVLAELPIGALLVSSEPRNAESHAQVVGGKVLETDENARLPKGEEP